MPRPKIYIHRTFGCPYDWYMDEENEKLLASFADVVNDGPSEEAIGSEQMLDRLSGVSGLLSLNSSGAADVTTKALRAVGTVKVAVISHWWHGGHDDAKATWEAAGVEVIDESRPCNEAVAEWTVGAAIAGLFRFHHYDREMKAGVEWPDRRAARQLNGSTLGIISLGRVGRIVADCLSPFDCRVIACDPGVDETKARELGVELVDLRALLREADVVSVHAPVTPQTRGMLGAEELSLMKDGAVLVNSARAAIFDGEALRSELSTGRFVAYMDVFEPEPPSVDDVLRTLDNVVMTPHIAGSTDMMFLRCGRAAIERLRTWLEKGSGTFFVEKGP